MFDRLFGKGRATAAARRAELRGDLARAVELFVEAELPEEAARVLLLRGDAEVDPGLRLVHYTQALAMAPEGSDVATRARRKRALFVLGLADGGAPPRGGEAHRERHATIVQRHDLLEAARDLELVGDAENAARAYARIGDTEGQARALGQAGDLDRLEHLLSEQHARERAERRRHDVLADVEVLIASGRRREALATAEAFARASESDAGMLRARVESLRARRARGPVARVLVRGEPRTFALGREVVLGRGFVGGDGRGAEPGVLPVASHAVSRRHLAIARRDGSVTVRDLGSRNGTYTRGLALAGELAVGTGIELTLARDVTVRISPADDPPGGVVIDVAGGRYIAPLGPAPIGIGEWRLDMGSDGWLELATGDRPPAHLDRLQLVPRATLLVGDALADARGADPILRVLG